MTFEELRSRITTMLADAPQRMGQATVHLMDIERGLAGLAQLGHTVMLELGTPPVAIQYPKMLYNAAGEMKVVNSSDEEAAAEAEGWKVHEAAAPAAVEMPGTTPLPAPTVKVALPGKGA